MCSYTTAEKIVSMHTLILYSYSELNIILLMACQMIGYIPISLQISFYILYGPSSDSIEWPNPNHQYTLQSKKAVRQIIQAKCCFFSPEISTELFVKKMI